MSNEKPTYKDLEKKVQKLEKKLAKRRKAQHAVNESETLFKNMFELHNATMLLIEPKSGIILNANNAAAKFYGYTIPTLCSMSINDLNMLTPEETRIERKNALAEKRNHFIFPHKLANGEIRTVEVHSSPIEFQNERILFSIIYDISERKQIEQELIQSKERLKIWINNSPVCTKIVDLDFNLQFMSDSGIRELQIDDITEFYGKPYPFHFYPNSFKVPMKNNLKKVVETGESITQEASVLDIKGNVLWYRSTLIPVKLNGQIDYILVVSLDITENKKAEQELRESEKRLRLIGDNIYKGQIYQYIVQPNGEKRFTYVSKNVTELYECTAEQLIADPYLLFNRVLPEDLPELQAATKKSIKEMSVFDHELRVKRNSGEIRWHRMISKPRKLNNGDILFDGLEHDITSQKEYELQLQKYSQELEKLNQDKDKFISILAHDMRNPFNSLIGFSDLLAENIRDFDLDEIESYVKKINNAALKNYSILEDVLEWSLASSDSKTYNPSDFQIQEVCQYVIEEENNQALKKNIQLLCKISPKLSVYADEKMMRTVLRNLISNAIKFTPRKGSITLGAKEKDKEILISVADTGIGIKKEALSKLFHIGENRSTPGTENEQGTGLGLQICKEFVAKMGGKIWAESEKGKGSVFYFTVPKQKN